MARIMYDRYLRGNDSLITISNTDADDMMTVIPESFTNTPVKMEFLDTGGINLEKLCLQSIEEEIEIPDGDIIRMVCGKLPGWRLVGVQFAPELGFSAYYANEHLLQTPLSDGNSSYRTAKGVSFYFVEHGHLEVKLEVDYADGLLPRCYIGTVTNKRGKVGIVTTVTEFFGKRRVKKMGLSEHEHRINDGAKEYLCHITEY